MSTPSLSSVTTPVQDLAATAADLAGDLAVAAVGQLEHLPERVAGLATAARERVSPPPKRSRRPWLLVVVVGVAAIALAWWWRRRRSHSVDIAEPYVGGRSTSGDRDAATSIAGH